MKTRAVAAVGCVVAILATMTASAVAQDPRFPDVPVGHYAFEAVEWAAGVGVTTGYEDGTFKPERPLIKRHAVVFMERYYDEILGAEESEDFTRGDMMVLLKAINDGALSDTDAGAEAESASGEATSPRFPDVPVGHYAFEAVEWAAGVGVTTGYEDGTFKPERPLIKRHAVVFMERYYDEILGAEESEDFTRGDMMVLLKAINDGALSDTAAPVVVDEYVWVAPYAGYVPAVHPDTPAPSWEQGTFVFGYQPPDRPRVSEEVQKFIDWCGDYFACDPMLLQMKWALDYLGAAESCIMPLYYTRLLEIEAAGHYLTSGRLAERFAWYRCPTVVDPRTPTVTEPAVKVQFPDREVLLLTPNVMSMAERCKTVLPEDVELEWFIGNRLDQLRSGLDCYEWGAFVEAAYKGNNAGCLRSAQLLREWMEHHYGLPVRFWRGFC